MSQNCELIGTYDFTKFNELPKNDSIIDFFPFESSQKKNNENIDIYIHLILSSGYCIAVCLTLKKIVSENLDLMV